MNLVKRGKKFYVRMHHGGHETWISTNQTTERKAKVAADRIVAIFDRERQTRKIANSLIDLAKQIAFNSISKESARRVSSMIEADALEMARSVVDEIIPAPPLLASELWEAYIRSAKAEQLKESALETKRQRFFRFASWVKSRDMRKFDYVSAEKFLDSLKVANQTRNNYISDISSVFSAMPDIGNPWIASLRRRSDTVHKRAFSRDQVRQILQYCRDRDENFWHTAVLLSYYTGLRLKDVVFFRRDQITEDGYIDLIPEKTSRTGKRIRIKASPRLLAELSKVTSIGPEYFPQEVMIYKNNRTKLPYKFTMILKGAGLYAPGYGFHSLRHTFVTESLNAGIDVKQVQSAVGHDAVEITEGVYYHGKRNADWSDYPDV